MIRVEQQSERLEFTEDEARCPHICARIVAFSSSRTRSTYYDTTEESSSEEPVELLEQTCTVRMWCDIPCQTRGKLGIVTSPVDRSNTWHAVLVYAKDDDMWVFDPDSRRNARAKVSPQPCLWNDEPDISSPSLRLRSTM